MCFSVCLTTALSYPLLQALECLMTWPLTQRNKIEDSKIEMELSRCMAHENETVKELAEKVTTFPSGSGLSNLSRPAQRTVGPIIHWLPNTEANCRGKFQRELPDYPGPHQAPQELSAEIDHVLHVETHVPIVKDDIYAVRPWDATDAKLKRVRYEVEEMPPAPFPTPPFLDNRPRVPSNPVAVWTPPSLVPRKGVDEIIAEAREQAIAEEKARLEAARLEAEKLESEAVKKEAKAKRRKERAERAERKSANGSGSGRKHRETPEQKEANKEKRLLKLVGAVVVKCMSKYAQQMEHDVFKKHAKEVRSRQYPDSLSMLTMHF